MIKNFFTIAIRHFARQRLYTLANLIGLSMGLTCILLIWLYISHETSFDTFRPGADRTYRILRQITTLLIVGYQTFKAATTNPVDTLHYE